MPILLLKVISLHILAAIQTAFPPRGADLVAQRSLFVTDCSAMTCKDACYTETKRSQIFPLHHQGDMKSKCYYITEQSGVGSSAHLRTLSAGLRKETGGQVSPGVGTCHLLA